MTGLRYGSASDVGRVRANNQDQLLVAAPLFAVADGMGGHAAGEVAALTAVQALDAAFRRHPDADGLLAAAGEANRAVWDLAQRHGELRGMGTTLVAMALVDEHGDGALAAVNIGDSRLYRLRDGELAQLTRDHSLVQELVDDGQLSEAEASVHPQRHVLTRAVGVDPEVVADLLHIAARPGDRFLLCSDGLPREVADDQIASILREVSDPDEVAKVLVEEAKKQGGSDNITVVVVDIVGDNDQHGMAAWTSGTDAQATTGRAGTARAGPTAPAVATAESAAMGLAAGTVDSDPADSGTVDSDQVTRLNPAVTTATAADRSGTQDRGGGRTLTTPVRPDRDPGRPAGAKAGRTRLLTPGVVGFFIALLAILAIAVGAVAWYARGSYFVGLQGRQITIFKGRPGGLLWFQPTVADRTGVTTGQVLAVHLPELRSGKEESSLGAAKQYVANLKAEAARAKAASKPQRVPPASTSTTSTVPPASTTTVPATPPTLTPTTVSLSGQGAGALSTAPAAAALSRAPGAGAAR